MLRIGINVKRLRDISGMKQEELARIIGVSQSEMSRIESRDDVDTETLEKISVALGYPLELFRMENLDTAISMVIQQSGNQGYVYNNSPVDKIIELYERWLSEKNAEIAALKAIVETLRQR